MIFEQIANGGCQSYFLGCADSRLAVLVGPNMARRDDYRALATRHGLTVSLILETHTHADHVSASRALAEELRAEVAMHPASLVPHAGRRLKDGETLKVGMLGFKALHTPGHTADSMCLQMDDRLFTGDTLLIGGTGRTDLPTGDAGRLHDSLFNIVLKLDPALSFYPAHEYKGRVSSTLGAELVDNPRLQKRDRADFVEMMRSLGLPPPSALAASLRANLGSGRSDAELKEAAPRVAARNLHPRMALVDLRGPDAVAASPIAGARHIPLGELEMRLGELPEGELVLVCETGEGAALAAATLNLLGYKTAKALHGGMAAWRSQRTT